MDKEKKGVTLTQEQYEALLGRVGALETKPQTTFTKVNRVQNHVATLMMFADNEVYKPIIRFDNIKTEQKVDEQGNIFYVDSDKINIYILDGEKEQKLKVNYLSLITNAQRVNVEILKMDKHTVEVNQDRLGRKFRTKPEDPKGYRESNQQFHSEQIDLVHTQLKMTATIKILEGEMEGKELVVDAECLNR